MVQAAAAGHDRAFGPATQGAAGQQHTHKMTSPLPHGVRRLLGDHIRSLTELRLLVALVDEPERWWDADSVANALQVSRRAAQLMLEHFARGNLLEVRLTGDVRYRFHPGTEALRQDALAGVSAYRTSQWS